MPATKHFVITVLSRDRVGIVASVTASINEAGGNIDAISQTVVRGYFTIIVKAAFAEDAEPEAIRSAIESGGGPEELEVSIKAWDEKAVSEPVVHDSDTFVLTVRGPDRPGFLAKISSFLASRNINVLDMWAYAEEGDFVFIAEIQISRSLDLGQQKLDLDSLFKKSGAVVSLQHENIFLATSKVDFHRGGM